jgi:uncharacterized protein
MAREGLPYALGVGKITLRVRVTPRAGRSGAGGLYHDAEGRPAVVVRVAAAPEKGRANKAVIATLAKSLKLAKSRLTITAGLADRNKTVAITGDPAEIEPALRGLMTTGQPDIQDQEHG